MNKPTKYLGFYKNSGFIGFGVDIKKPKIYSWVFYDFVAQNYLNKT